MKKYSSKIIVSVMLIVAMMSLSACSLLKFDAAGYVKAVLDASTRAEFEEYIKLTKSAEQEAQAEFDAVIDVYMAEFDSVSISDEIKENYRQLFKDMLAKTKYTVGEATDSDDTYTVEVSVEPLNIFDGYDEEVEAALTEYENKLTAEYEESEAVPSEEEILEETFTIIYDITKARVDGGTYDPAQIVAVTVAKNAEGYYTIADESYDALFNLLIIEE